jgi:hypothetical protein
MRIPLVGSPTLLFLYGCTVCHHVWAVKGNTSQIDHTREGAGLHDYALADSLRGRTLINEPLTRTP